MAHAIAAVRRFVRPKKRWALIQPLFGLLDVAVEGGHGGGLQVFGEGALGASRQKQQREGAQSHFSIVNRRE
jgi:hypothetical protein